MSTRVFINLALTVSTFAECNSSGKEGRASLTASALSGGDHQIGIVVPGKYFFSELNLLLIVHYEKIAE